MVLHLYLINRKDQKLVQDQVIGLLNIRTLHITVQTHILELQLIKLKKMYYTGKESISSSPCIALHQQTRNSGQTKDHVEAVLECLISQSITTSMFTDSLHDII